MVAKPSTNASAVVPSTSLSHASSEEKEKLMILHLQHAHYPANNFSSMLQIFSRPRVLSVVYTNGEYPYNQSVSQCSIKKITRDIQHLFHYYEISFVSDDYVKL